MKYYTSTEAFLAELSSASNSIPQLPEKTAHIIENVRQSGDDAVLDFTRKFDGVSLKHLKVSKDTVSAAANKIPAETRKLLQAAIERVRLFHQRQQPDSWKDEREDGSWFGMQFTPIERVGLYVPGGSAGYPSTLIMTAVPAQIAGVNRLVLVSPPTKDSGINSLVLATAQLLGIEEIYAIGGAQAIAALAYGTETIPKVDKIVGPGNAYVNEAKRQVFGVVGIDQLAGPSEVVILADDTANPDYVLKDLCAQAEHDSEARVILVTTSNSLAQELYSKMTEYVSEIERKEIVRAALDNHGAIVEVSSIDEGVALVNKIAPEHLQIFTGSPEALLPDVRNAGAICLGAFTPAVVGDYFAGPNHVLPTGGTARFSSPLNVLDFMKFSSVLHYSKATLNKHGQQIANFAKLEGLLNHMKAIQCRS